MSTKEEKFIPTAPDMEEADYNEPQEDLAKDTLEDRVKLRIGVIGIGNAGSQIVGSAYAAGFSVFVLNSSLKDLSDTVVNENIPSFIVGDEARGAGKNRQKAKELFRSNGKTLFAAKRFDYLVESSDIIFVCASTAGGTGSGIAPDLIAILAQMYPNKIVIFYGIIPKLSDSIIAQHNTVQCMDEINKLKVPFMLGDLSHYEDVPNDVAYNQIGKHIVESISVISGKYLFDSNNGMIDENDMRVIVSEPGYMGVYMLNGVTPAQVDIKPIQKYMIDVIKKSPAAPIQRDDIVKELGVIVNCPDEMMEATKTGNYNDLTGYIGTPLAIFENYSVAKGSHGQFIIIMSGMNLPYSRILLCSEKIEQHEEKLRRAKVIDLSTDVEKFGFLDSRGDPSKLVDTSKVRPDEAKKSSVLEGFFK